MTKGKKWTLRLLGVAALALLICLCLLGSTMARYTSSGNGSGTLTVAVWDLEAAEVKLPEGAISPSNDEYNATTARTHTSAWTKALDMVNNSDVAAKVTVALNEDENTEENISIKFSDEFKWGEGWGSTVNDGREQTNDYASKIMAMFSYGSTDDFESLVNAWGVFSIELAYETDSTTFGAIETVDSAGETVYLVKMTEEDKEFELASKTDAETAQDASNSKTIYAEVVWTSICEANGYNEQNQDANTGAIMPDGFKDGYEAYGSSDWEVFSDAVDTILGMYTESLSFGVTWTAVQDSTLP